MHWLGENKETSIKQIEFKSFGRAGSQRASPGNGFGLHWDSPGPSLLTNEGLWGAGDSEGPTAPTSHPHPSTLHPRVVHSVLLTHQGISEHCQAAPPSPNSCTNPHSSGIPPNSASSPPSLGSFQPLYPVSLTESQPGPADTNRAIGSQSRNGKSQHLGRAVGLAGSESSLGTGAIPSCPSAQLRDDPWRHGMRGGSPWIAGVRSPEG